MAVRNTLKSLILNGKPVTPTGDSNFPLTNDSYEAIDNLDGSVDYQFIPGNDPATLSITADAATIAHVSSTMALAPGSWTLSGYMRTGQSVSMTNCGIVNKPSPDGAGAIELEIRGVVRWS